MKIEIHPGTANITLDKLPIKAFARLTHDYLTWKAGSIVYKAQDGKAVSLGGEYVFEDHKFIHVAPLAVGDSFTVTV